MHFKQCTNTIIQLIKNFQITKKLTFEGLMNNLNTNQRNSLIIENLNLAEKLAKRKKRKLSHISYDELKSAAFCGLVEAANSYNSSKNNCFPAYALWRITGAIQDYLRELSWGSRSKPLKRAQSFIYEEQLYKTDNFGNLDSFDEIIYFLPEINKTVLKLYYQQDMLIKEIAVMLCVHQSRISQILQDSKQKLLKILQTQEGELCKAAA